MTVATVVDTTIIKSTLHHIDKDAQTSVLKVLARNTKKRIIIDEEVFGDLGKENVKAKNTDQESLRKFSSLQATDQLDCIILIDYIGNIVLGGDFNMNMPFSFNKKDYWVRVLANSDFIQRHLSHFILQIGNYIKAVISL